MDDRYVGARRKLESNVLLGPGKAPTAVRQAAAGRGDMPADLAAYVEKVRSEATRITDEEVAALRAAGHTDDELLELTWAAAVGAARDHFEAATAALRKGERR